jgi:hypothetical protein
VQAATQELEALREQLETQRRLAEANLNPKRPGEGRKAQMGGGGGNCAHDSRFAAAPRGRARGPWRERPPRRRPRAGPRAGNARP